LPGNDLANGCAGKKHYGCFLARLSAARAARDEARSVEETRVRAGSAADWIHKSRPADRIAASFVPPADFSPPASCFAGKQRLIRRTMKRNASAIWRGNLKNGKGSLSSDSGVLKDTPYSFGTRFENSPGTNPEELIAAAHAGCFSMALSAALQTAGFTADTIRTTAALSLENVPATSWTITAVHLTTVAAIPGIAAEKFAEIAAGAKANCPVSRVLKAEITLDAKLA